MIAPARTGRASSSRKVVIRILQANKGMCSGEIVLGRIFKIVMIKLSELRIDEIPAK